MIQIIDYISGEQQLFIYIFSLMFAFCFLSYTLVALGNNYNFKITSTLISICLIILVCNTFICFSDYYNFIFNYNSVEIKIPILFYLSIIFLIFCLLIDILSIVYVFIKNRIGKEIFASIIFMMTSFTFYMQKVYDKESFNRIFENYSIKDSKSILINNIYHYWYILVIGIIITIIYLIICRKKYKKEKSN